MQNEGHSFWTVSHPRRCQGAVPTVPLGVEIARFERQRRWYQDFKSEARRSERARQEHRSYPPSSQVLPRERQPQGFKRPPTCSRKYCTNDFLFDFPSTPHFVSSASSYYIKLIHYPTFYSTFLYIQYALERGHRYLRDATKQHTARGYYDTGLKDLIDASPSVHVTPDPKTGLYPFMLAATSPSNEVADLTTVYELLRSSPDSVSSGITK